MRIDDKEPYEYERYIKQRNKNAKSIAEDKIILICINEDDQKCKFYQHEESDEELSNNVISLPGFFHFPEVSLKLTHFYFELLPTWLQEILLPKALFFHQFRLC